MTKNSKYQNCKKKVENMLCVGALVIVVIFVAIIIFSESINLKWMNDNSGAIVAILTAVLVLITIYYAWQTKQSVKIMQNAEKNRTRPYLSVYLEQMQTRHSYLYLVIENTGNTPAYNVKFDISEDFEIDFGVNKKLSEIRQIKNGIRMLSNRKVLKIPFLSLIGKVDFFANKNLRIMVKYYDASGKDYEEYFDINIDDLVESRIGTDPIVSIDKSIKQIVSSVEKIQKDIKLKQINDKK